MKQPAATISIRIVLNTVIVFLTALTVLTVTDYLLEGAVTASGTASGLFTYYLTFMTGNVLPILAVFGIFLYFYTGPIQRVAQALESSQAVAPKEMARAKGRIFALPRIILLLNFLSFFGGTILFFSTQGYFSDIASPRLWFQLVFTLSSSGVYAFVQTSMNNQVLARARSLMGIHRIEQQGFKDMSLNRKTMLITVLLALYGISYFVPKLVFAYEIELAYSAELQQVVLGQKSLAQAQEDFSRRFGDFSVPPAFSLEQRDFNAQQAQVRSSLFGAGIALAVIIALIALVYSRELIMQIRMQQRKMRDILEGSDALSERIAITSYDEVGQLSDLINRFMDLLAGMLTGIARSAGSISHSSQVVDGSISAASDAMHEIVTTVEQISSSSDDQALAVDSARKKILAMQESIRRIGSDMENQASFVEQTSGAMTEMAGNIASVSRNTQQANALGEKLTRAARTGEEKIRQSVQAIGAVEEATDTVSAIVKVLSDIAGQTNLLAMNAAIEAAHAGDAGRGFAVVAAEIRKLAENSAVQAKEIVQQIGTMTSRVEAGVTQTREAGEAFRSILQDIQETTQLINEVSAAMVQQKAGTDEILSSVGSVVDASNSIKERTRELQDQSSVMDQQMQDLVHVATHIREATTEQSRSNVEVSQMISRLKETSQGNMEVVNQLQAILSKFQSAQLEKEGQQWTST